MLLIDVGKGLVGDGAVHVGDRKAGHLRLLCRHLQQVQALTDILGLPVDIKAKGRQNRFARIGLQDWSAQLFLEFFYGVFQVLVLQV